MYSLLSVPMCQIHSFSASIIKIVPFSKQCRYVTNHFHVANHHVFYCQIPLLLLTKCSLLIFMPIPAQNHISTYFHLWPNEQRSCGPLCLYLCQLQLHHFSQKPENLCTYVFDLHMQVSYCSTVSYASILLVIFVFFSYLC